MRRWQAWGCGLLFLAVCGFGTAVLFPIFASARAATKMSEEEEAIHNFRIALMTYAERHGDRLPGKNWRKDILSIDPSLAGLIHSQEDGWFFGLAAVPGTQNRKYEDLPGDTILFVGYRSTSDVDVLKRVADIGDFHWRDRTMVLSVEGVMNGGGMPLYESNAEIGFRLAKQGVPDLN